MRRLIPCAVLLLYLLSASIGVIILIQIVKERQEHALIEEELRNVDDDIDEGETPSTTPAMDSEFNKTNPSVFPGDWLFNLGPGRSYYESDQRTLRFHQESIDNSTMLDNNATANAVTEYLAAIARLTNADVKVRASEEIASFLDSTPCPSWDLLFSQPAQYMLCDCMSLETRQWYKHNSNTIRHIKYPISQVAIREIHRCNSIYAYVMLGMLYAEHGATEGGMIVFRNDGSDLYFQALSFDMKRKRMKTAAFARTFSSLRRHLNNNPEKTYNRMNRVITALNSMYYYDSFTRWGSRLYASITNETEHMDTMELSATNQESTPFNIPSYPPYDPYNVFNDIMIYVSSVLFVGNLMFVCYYIQMVVRSALEEMSVLQEML